MEITFPTPGSEISEGATVDIVVSSGKGSTKTIETSVALPTSVNADLSLKVYRNGTVVEENTVNPAYASSYALSFSGTSGKDTVVVRLNDQDYMQFTFDFDTQQATMTDSWEFTPPTTSSPDNSASGGGDDPGDSSEYTGGEGTGNIQPSGD